MTMNRTTGRLAAFERERNVRIAARNGFWLTGLVSTGPFTDANERISSLWTDLVARRDEIDAPSDEWLSLCHGRETEFSCYLGLVSDKRPDPVPGGMVSIELLPHEYAVAAVDGTQEDVNTVYTHLPAWIEARGREWNRSILWIEAYPEPYRDDETQLRFEVWLPLVEVPVE